MIFIIVGRSASGKDSLLKELLKNHEDFKRMLSLTTRPMRPGEVNGEDYIFVSEGELLEYEREGLLAEWRIYETIENGQRAKWFYGSPLIKNYDGEDTWIGVLDPTGARKAIERYGKGNVFILQLLCGAETRRNRAEMRPGFELQEWERREAADESSFDLFNECHLADNYIYTDTSHMTPQEVAKVAMSFYNNYRTKMGRGWIT